MDASGPEKKNMGNDPWKNWYLDNHCPPAGSARQKSSWHAVAVSKSSFGVPVILKVTDPPGGKKWIWMALF
jgi:hypothetical protein